MDLVEMAQTSFTPNPGNPAAITCAPPSPPRRACPSNSNSCPFFPLLPSRAIMAMPSPARKGRQPPPNDSGLYESLRRFWHKSYAGDYLGLILLLVAYILLKFFNEPWKRLFRLDDPRIAFPHAEIERVAVCTSIPLHICRHTCIY